MTCSDAPPPYDTIVFDCDSTLSDMEGIESLASPNQLEQIARLTDAAMSGEIALETVFGLRLEIVRPSRADLDAVGRAYVDKKLANTGALIRALRFLGKRVVIVSGGLLHAVAHLAAELDVDETLAVGTSFDANGDYAGFDEASPLAKSGGKSDVLEELAARTGSDAIAFIGDGATDLEAAHRAARFIAFGGVVRRDNVFEAAAVTCESADFRDLVPLLMTPAEIARLKVAPDHAALVAAAPHPTPHSD